MQSKHKPRKTNREWDTERKEGSFDILTIRERLRRILVKVREKIKGKGNIKGRKRERWNDMCKRYEREKKMK